MKMNAHGLEREIYRAVLDAVSEQRLPPGAKLTEENLAQIFRTSRTTVRRALVRLEHDKIVALKPNRGAFVAQPSVEEARQVFEARRVIEEAACRGAAGRLGATDVKRLKALAERAHQAHDGDEPAREVRLSGEFHREIARLSGNAIVSQFVDELVFRSSLIVALYQRKGAPDCSFEEHLAILEALRDGRGEEAAELMVRHLIQVESGLDLRPPAQAPINLEAIFSRRV